MGNLNPAHGSCPIETVSVEPVCTAHFHGVRSCHPDARNLTSTPSQVGIHNIVRPIPYAFWLRTGLLP
jgi:hypothetical protein